MAMMAREYQCLSLNLFCNVLQRDGIELIYSEYWLVSNGFFFFLTNLQFQCMFLNFFHST